MILSNVVKVVVHVASDEQRFRTKPGCSLLYFILDFWNSNFFRLIKKCYDKRSFKYCHKILRV